MSQLFTPFEFDTLTIPNRIVVAPMCQYSAIDGTMTDWHLMHLGQYAVSGAGLVFVEATGVEAAGRITHGCTGLYSDENEAAMARVVEFYRNHGVGKIGIQLGHAGRKASCSLPWEGDSSLEKDKEAWETFAPSALPFADGWHMPTALSEEGLVRIKQAFIQAGERAVRLGFDVIEMHSAHGYLLHQFLSPLSNHRDDRYGGSLENRMRFPLEIFAALRETAPDMPVGVRFSATDWVEDSSWALDEATHYARALQALGCDFVDVSSGGNNRTQGISVGPGYQVGFAEHIRRETGIPTMAVGMITEPQQAETILATGQADFVALARGMLYDPRWPWHAAEKLGAQALFPPQYKFSHPSLMR